MSNQSRWWQRIALALAASAGLSAAFWQVAKQEARRIQFRRLDLVLPNLPFAFEGYRIAHLTDIHTDGTAIAEERLAEAVAWINRMQPDLVALTGDFVTLKRPADTGALIEQLQQLRASDGVFAVMGNHDHKRNRYMVEAALQMCAIPNLANKVVPIERNGATVMLCGVDSLSRRRARLDRVLRALNKHDRANGEKSCAILLAHEPDFADISSPTYRFDLQLSGHAHGGQIRVPFVTRRVLPVYGERYSNGLYLVKGMTVYSNRGLGTTGLPLRFRCPPEVALITLHSRR